MAKKQAKQKEDEIKIRKSDFIKKRVNMIESKISKGIEEANKKIEKIQEENENIKN